jgi:hypothetical protein
MSSFVVFFFFEFSKRVLFLTIESIVLCANKSPLFLNTVPSYFFSLAFLFFSSMQKIFFFGGKLKIF